VLLVWYSKGIYLKENTMKNLLLGIIAINLTFISINMMLRSVEPVSAQLSQSDISWCWDRAKIEKNGDGYIIRTYC